MGKVKLLTSGTVVTVLVFVSCLGCFLNFSSAQVAYLSANFTGGVSVTGHRTIGSGNDRLSFLEWNSQNQIYKAFACTYRYGRPEPYTIYINNTPVTWSEANQIGPEQIEINLASEYFAVHVQDVTENLEIAGDTVVWDFPPQTYIHSPNVGYWGCYLVVLYTNPSLIEPLGVQLLVADQNQIHPQEYFFDQSKMNLSHPVALSVYTDRLTEAEIDRSRVWVENTLLGDIWGADDLIPISTSGVQGHFYYENSTCTGMRDDTCDSIMYRNDGLANIAYTLNGGDEPASLRIRAVNLSLPDGRANPHPAFTLAYTPTCQVVEANLPSRLVQCPGDSLALDVSGLPFNHVNWHPGFGMHIADTLTAVTTLQADSSAWLRVTLSSDTGNVCPVTLPIAIEVPPVPRTSLTTQPAACPDSTGQVVFGPLPEAFEPYTYTAGATSATIPLVENLPQGPLNFSVEDRHGCTWDTTLTLPFTASHTAAFTASPESGKSPLEVYFNNTSTGATHYLWNIGDTLLAEAQPPGDFATVFEQPGNYPVTLVAYNTTNLCTDTARFTVVVEQGLSALVPTIISPNGDNRNDGFAILPHGVQVAQLTVTNRWGTAVHTSQHANLPDDQPATLWQPESNLTAGTYFYVLRLSGPTGKTQTLSGSVQVVR